MPESLGNEEVREVSLMTNLRSRKNAADRCENVVLCFRVMEMTAGHNVRMATVGFGPRRGLFNSSRVLDFPVCEKAADRRKVAMSSGRAAVGQVRLPTAALFIASGDQ